MRHRHVGIGALAAVLALAVPVLSHAATQGELVVRSSRVDYEVGQRVDWTVDWLDGQPADPDADDVVVSLDGPHEFIEGSVQMPRGWSVSYSGDGDTFVDEPAGLVTHLKFAREPVTIPAGVAASSAPRDIVLQLLVPRPIPPIVTARNGGDGYIPMLAGDRIYAVWHHMAAGANPEPNMVCIDTLTGKACPNYPKVLGWQTSFNQGQGVFVNGKIYIKNRDATTHGVLCWNTRTEQSCGYSPVATLGPVTGGAGGDGGWDQFSSPVVHNGRLFFAGHNYRVYCFDPNTEKVCADYGLAGKASARVGETHVTTRRLNDVVYHGGRMIFSLATSWMDVPIPLGTKDFCFDLDAGAPCPDWGINGVVTETAGTAYTFTRYDASGIPIGYCHGVQSGAGEAPLQPTVPCYDFNGKNRTTIPAVQPFGQFRPYNVEEDTLGTRTFFGRYSTLGAYCYDWATSAPCKGTFFDVNGRSTQSLAEHFYGFVHRGGCMVGLGHKGIFVSVDPFSGASPCRELTDASAVASASSRFCRDTKYLDGWRLAKLSGVLAADFSKFQVSVTDGVSTVAGDMLNSDLALAGLDPGRDVQVSLSATVNPTADPWSKDTPRLNLLYGGSNQFCFQTVAKAITKPLVVEAETNGLTDAEEVVVDPTPDDEGEPSEAGTFVKEQELEQLSTNAGPPSKGTLPATGNSPAELLGLALALAATGGVLRARRRVGPSR